MDHFELIKIRVLSFLYQVGTALVVLLIGYLSSAEFATLVQEHFGTIVATLVSLIIPEIVKHIHNMRALGNWQRLGGGEYRRPTFI